VPSPSSTAVTKGDLTRSIQVEARGEVAELKDTSTQNRQPASDYRSQQKQDWLKTNLARFTACWQGQRDLETVGRLLRSS